MQGIRKSLFGALLVLACSQSFAQTPYEKIEVGTVLTSGGIALGVFAKPIPLPTGEWLVVSKRADDIALTSKRTGSSATPKIILTLKNNKAENAMMFGMVLSFTPEASNVNWGNNPCESKNPKIITDTFGSKPESMQYVCSYMNPWSGLKGRIEKAPESTNKWFKANLTDLAAYANEAPDNAFMVDVFGNQYKGRNIYFTFILKREGDVEADAAYAQHMKVWQHATGEALRKVLDNSAAEFVLPAPYASKS